MSKPKLSINRQVTKSYQELYEDYLKVAKIRNLSPVTIRTYKYHHQYWMKYVVVQRIKRCSILQIKWSRYGIIRHTPVTLCDAVSAK